MQMCSNVIQPSSLIGIFETLLSSAATTIDEDTGNPSWQSRADFYVICILSSLPWGGAELNEVREFCKRYVSLVKIFLSGLRRVYLTDNSNCSRNTSLMFVFSECNSNFSFACLGVFI